MPDQVSYYNHFAKINEQNILQCAEPELWTTDYQERGRVYQEMKERINQQEKLILDHFNKKLPVLDVGCGFGRQAILLAKHGFMITGTDTNEVFISIAQKLFTKFNYKGNFVYGDVISDQITGNYQQLLLLDVLEHIKLSQRRKMFKRLTQLSEPGGILILSLPHVKKRLISQLNNLIRRNITQHFSYFLNKEEHPYPIPQKKNILRLISNYFSVNKFIETKETDYYVLKRI